MTPSKPVNHSGYASGVGGAAKPIPGSFANRTEWSVEENRPVHYANRLGFEGIENPLTLIYREQTVPETDSPRSQLRA